MASKAARELVIASGRVIVTDCGKPLDGRGRGIDRRIGEAVARVDTDKEERFDSQRESVKGVHGQLKTVKGYTGPVRRIGEAR